MHEARGCTSVCLYLCCLGLEVLFLLPPSLDLLVVQPALLLESMFLFTRQEVFLCTGLEAGTGGASTVLVIFPLLDVLELLALSRALKGAKRGGVLLRPVFVSDQGVEPRYKVPVPGFREGPVRGNTDFWQYLSKY